jgi:hypothetical protein
LKDLEAKVAVFQGQSEYGFSQLPTGEGVDRWEGDRESDHLPAVLVGTDDSENLLALIRDLPEEWRQPKGQ